VVNVTAVIGQPERLAKRRRLVRFAAAVLAATTSVLYFLIGFGVVTVLQGTAAQQETGGQAAFGVPAGIAFLAGAFVVLRFDRRSLWTLGAVVLGFIIYTYFDLASERTPSFEIWGILIRVSQVLLLGALTYLAARSKHVRGGTD